MRGAAGRISTDACLTDLLGNPEWSATHTELAVALLEKERAGAARVAAAAPGGAVAPLTLEDEWRLRMSAVAFIWDCGRSGRLGADAVHEAALNTHALEHLDRGDAFVAGDGAHNTHLATRHAAVAASLKGRLPREVRHALAVLGRPREARVRHAEDVLSNIAKIGAAGTVHTLSTVGVTRVNFTDVDVAAAVDRGVHGADRDAAGGCATARATLRAWRRATGGGGSTGSTGVLESTLHAITLLHAFFLAHSFREYDRFAVAATCLFVAFKHSDILPVAGAAPIASVVAAARFFLPGRYPAAADGEALGKTVLRLEGAVLRVVGCDLQRHLPHTCVDRILAAAAATAHDETDPPSKRRRASNGNDNGDATRDPLALFHTWSASSASVARAVLNDAYVATDMHLRYTPVTLAVAALLVGRCADPEPEVAEARGVGVLGRLGVGSDAADVVRHVVGGAYGIVCGGVVTEGGVVDPVADADLHHALSPRVLVAAWRELIGVHTPAPLLDASALAAADPARERADAAVLAARAGRWRRALRAAAHRTAYEARGGTEGAGGGLPALV